MHTLVTGGAGFIGSHLVDRLLAGGEEVTCVDDFNDFYDPLVKRANLERASVSPAFRLVTGDIRDAAVLERAFDRPVDRVVHLAARAGVRPSLLEPALYYDVNVMGTLQVLEAMRRHKTGKLLFASSSSVYGNNEKIPFAETDSVDNPVSPYAASKKAGELLCYSYHHLYGIDTFCLRFFTVYGPRQRPEMAIHQFLRRILEGHPITMFGDGTTRRDYTYIDDILDGILRALERVCGYEVFNLGESRTVSLRELIQTMEEVTGRRATIDRQGLQPGDVNVTFADISKARALLGYNPRWTVREGLEQMAAWLARTAPSPDSGRPRSGGE